MGAKDSSDQYSPEEAKERMVAALRGARLAGHVPMKAKEKLKVKPKKVMPKKREK